MTPAPTQSPTRQLAQFVHQSSWSDLPPQVQHEAVRAFVNWVGCAYGGADHAAVERALPALDALSGSRQCTVIGRPVRLDPLSAALVNGISVGVNAFDDAHVLTVIHPAAPTIAALLAHAEQHTVSGTQFLHALVLSHELQSRLSCALAVAPAKCHIGHFMTGLIGPVGVAAGVGKLMGLSEQRLVWAMGVGAMQGGGFRSAHATLSTPLIPGLAGRGGLLAAHLAAGDFTCQEEPLASRYGLLSVVGNPPNLDVLTDRLGQHWECMNVAIKPFPNGCVIHAATEACLEVALAHRFESGDIERVDLQVSKLTHSLADIADPQDQCEAWVSLHHWAAAVLRNKAAGLNEGSDICVHDPEVMALRQRVTPAVADDLQPDEARASVTLRDGRVLQAEVRPHVGSAARPLSDEQLQAKFLAQVEPRLGAERARALADACWNLAQASDVGSAAPGYWGALAGATTP